MKERHFAHVISRLYDEVCEENGNFSILYWVVFYFYTNKLTNQNLGIRNKVFKIVADSGANVKKAFIDPQSADNDRIDYAEIVTSLLEKVNIEESIDASESKTDSDWFFKFR